VIDWKTLVKSIAPTLGTTLGGPAAGLAVKFLADRFLGKPDAGESDVADAIMAASPEKLLEVKKLDNDFKVQMKQLDIDVYKLEVEDRRSARDLAKFDIGPHVVLSALYTFGYFAVLYLFLTGNVQVATDAKDAFNQIIGVLTAAQVTILAFWFGSSYGSKVKDVQAAKA
jgi:hypothetical protein